MFWCNQDQNAGFNVLFWVVSMVMMTSFPLISAMPKEDSYRARVRIYVDKAGVDEFGWSYPDEDLTDHVEKMIATVNQAYKSLLPTVNVTLQLEKVIALDKNIYKKSNRDLHVYHDKAAFEFWEWTMLEDNEFKYDAKAFDLAVLLTGYELYNDNGSGMFGYAYIGSVCTRNAVGAVEIQEPQGTVGLAHEIGHILGANHDDLGATKSLCGPGTYKYGNLMNTITKLRSPLRWTFSECSTREIAQLFANMTRDDANCMLIPGDKNASVPVLPTTADEWCQQEKGAGWTMDRHGSRMDDFCQFYRCVRVVDGQRERTKVTPPDGMRCGKSKRCFNKKCVYVTHGDPNMSDECPYGSQGDDYVMKVYRSTCADLGCPYGVMCCGDCPTR